jgi:hypothetical protein
MTPTDVYEDSGVPLAPPQRNVMLAGRTLGIVAALILVQAVLVAAFVLPGHSPEPHDVPVGVVGPPVAVETLEGAQPGAFDAERYSSEAAARRSIEEREVYGAFVVEGGERRLLIASAASATVAQILRGAVETEAGEVTVEDVAPLDPDDPRGTTLNLLFLPLVVVCLPAVLLLTSLRLPARALIGALALFAALGGLVIVALAGEAIGALPGSYLALAGVTALSILAIALPTAGFARMLRRAGVGVGALLFFVIANPASGNASAPELLPGFWRAISQFMPPGAGGTGLRNTAYFDGNAVLEPLVVLSAYAVVGTLLVLGADALRRRRPHAEIEHRPALQAAAGKP